ncbi:nucleotidyl transferase AbiEii/AbiGii toxin family protein [Candidatus Woesearchaeota archaeon]|nr:nucleotidyl transferase AbiEii/AbiGii toxin family protein [Candidatus Woesearchaeota archaeon]
MKTFIERENEIFDILESFNKAELEYVLIGGYAVSAYMRRFSVDADICINKKDLHSFQNILKGKHFEFVKRRILEDTYKGEFECYVKKTKLPVTVDLMIGSVASSQTNGSVSFTQLFNNSITKKVTGIEEEINVRIPVKEVLIALKLHAARMTDARDIVALCHDIDFEFVKKFVQTGSAKNMQENLNRLLSYFKSDNFRDAFKGVFSIERLPRDNIDNAIKLAERLKREVKE